MQRTRSKPAAASAASSHVGLGLDRQPDLEAVLARLRRDGRRVGDGLEMERDAVGARGLERAEVVLRVVDHQVAVDHPALAVDERRDRLEHDRADGDRLDEVPVADVEVEDPRARAEQLLDLLPEPGEVGRVQRRLDLDRADPLIPGHGAILRPTQCQTLSRATKNPDVPWRCGAVSRNRGSFGWRNCGHSAPRSIGREAGGLDDRLVLVRVQRANGEERPSRRLHALCGRAKQRELELGQRLRAPAQVGAAGEDAEARARRVDEGAVEARRAPAAARARRR